MAFTTEVYGFTVSLIPLAVAAFAHFALGALWYGNLFASMWIEAHKAQGTPLFQGGDDAMKKRMAEINMTPTFLLTLACNVLKALVLSVVLAATGTTTVIGAVGIALIGYSGFTLTMAHHTAWARQSHTLLFVDQSFELVGTIIQAIAIVVLGTQMGL